MKVNIIRNSKLKSSKYVIKPNGTTGAYYSSRFFVWELSNMYVAISFKRHFCTRF